MQNIKSAVGWTSISTVARAFIQIALLSMLVQQLSKAEFSAYVIAQSLLLIGGVLCDFGLGTMIVVRKINRRSVLHLIVALQLIVGLLVAVTFLFAGPTLLAFMGIEVGLVYAVSLALAMLFMTSSIAPLAVMQTNLRWKSMAIIELGAAIVTLVAMAICLAYQGTASAGLTAFAFAAAFRTIWLWSSSGVSFSGVSLQFNKRRFSYLLSFGKYRTASMSINQFGSHADVFLIGKLLGADNLALYTAVKSLLQRCFQFLTTLISSIALPLLSQSNSKQELEVNYVKMLAVVCAVVFPIFAALGFLSLPVILILFGEGYSEASSLMTYMCVVFALRVTMNLGGQAVLSRSLVKASLNWNIAVLLITITTISVFAQISLLVVVYALALVQCLLWIGQAWLMLNNGCGIRFVKTLRIFLLWLLPSMLTLVLSFIISERFVTNNIYFEVLIFGALWSTTALLSIAFLIKRPQKN